MSTTTRRRGQHDGSTSTTPPPPPDLPALAAQPAAIARKWQGVRSA